MTIYLLRHGRTRLNEERRYQGRRLDVPLSPSGAQELRRADFTPGRLYVSPMLRARETARHIFPEMEQEVVEDFAEMDFGLFEGRSAEEMEHDAAYQAWVAGGALGRCPEGEELSEFTGRICRAFETLLDREADTDSWAIVAHGGTLCAIMERYALPERGYFQWFSPNGGGYRLERDAALWKACRRLRLSGGLLCAEETAPC